MTSRPTQVAVVIPAKDEADRIADTVRAVHTIDGVDLVVVVDDGSADGTADVARAADAHVVRHERNRGKAAAMTTGARWVAAREVTDGTDHPRILLFADADLGRTATALGALVAPVLAGEAAMTIATLPPQTAPGGGRGRVVRAARTGIERLTGLTMAQPLSGQRAVTRQAYDDALPLAAGWGVEVGLTIDVARAGHPILEVPCDLQHRVSGADWAGAVHRAAQLRDVLRALARRTLRR